MNKADYLASWSALKAEFRSRGYFIPNTRRIAAELALHVGLLLGGTALYLLADNLWLAGLGVAASALGSLGVSTNAHTASHRCAHRSARVNRSIACFGYSFLLGLPATYWHQKHCVMHHANPNIIGLDADIEFRPVFAIHTAALDRVRGLARHYYKYQWLIAPLAISLNAFNIQRQGWLYLIRRRPLAWIDLICSVAHLAIFLGVASLWFGPVAALGGYVLRSVVLSYAVFALFVPAHWPEEAACAQRAVPSMGFAARQTFVTLNFRLGPVTSLFASGLEYQIEHHLFPLIDHTRYRAMSCDVQAFCDRHGLPYRCLAWSEALRKALRVFHRPKHVLPSLLPAHAERCDRSAA